MRKIFALSILLILFSIIAYGQEGKKKVLTTEDFQQVEKVAPKTLNQSPTIKPNTEIIRSALAQPIKSRYLTKTTKNIEIFSFDFKEPYFGREGPNYFPTKDAPSKGAEQFVTVSLFGQESTSTIKFEAIDEKGKVIQLLYLFKVGDSLGDEQYDGWIDVPKQPFQIMVSGKDINGNLYKHIYKQLFQPTDKPPKPIVLPANLAQETIVKLKASVAEYEKRLKAEFAEKRRANPDGINITPHMEVTNITHEPYISPKSNILGIRILYDVIFSKDGIYSLTPLVSPFYEDYQWHGKVEMMVANEAINPMPEFSNQQQTGGFHKAIFRARYKSNTLYRFMVDMVPDYVIQNVDRTKYCIYNQKFQGSAQASNIWEILKTKNLPIKYLVTISSVGYSGEIDLNYSQHIFYQGFIKEGAQDCGASPTNRF